MVKPWILAVAAMACTGCMMTSLDRNSVAQANTVMDLRYREVLDDAALIASCPAALPSYVSIFTGTSQITDTGTMVSTTMWQHVKAAGAQNGFASEAANPQFSRQVFQNWALDPIMVPEKLEALRACYRWVVYGPQTLGARDTSLLASPDEDPSPGRHFGVADRLQALPPGWLHVGVLKDVPAAACLTAHCCDVWVWVLPDGMPGLADFTLIMQDIARVDSNSTTLFTLPPAPSILRFATSDPPFLKRPDDPSQGRDIKLYVTVAVDPCGRLTSYLPYVKARFDNIGADAHIHAAINAAGATR